MGEGAWEAMKVHEFIEKTLEDDAIARTALARGIMNTSAYARELSALYTKQTGMALPLPGMIRALNRLRPLVTPDPEAYFVMDKIATFPGIMAFTVNSHEVSEESLLWLKSRSFDRKMFYVELWSPDEVIIFCENDLILPLWQERGRLNGIIGSQGDLGILALTLDGRYRKNPTVIKKLCAILEQQEIQIEYTLSTDKDLLLVLHGHYLVDAVSTMSPYLDPTKER